MGQRIAEESQATRHHEAADDCAEAADQHQRQQAALRKAVGQRLEQGSEKAIHLRLPFSNQCR